LEATAPKVGNVYPSRPFDDLSYADFVAAAEITAQRVGRSKRRISHRMLAAIEESVSEANTNVNLGIVLLLGPLVAADEVLTLRGVTERTNEAWISAIAEVLGELDGSDGRNVYRAIDLASAGGLGHVDALDVHDTIGEVDLIEAMKLAADRDRIARQYATGFTDLILQVVPVVADAIDQSGDLLQGIGHAHLLLLQQEPDTLIARKNGIEVAISVQNQARQVDLNQPASVAEFDQALRGKTHRLNPGTSADLVAAAMYVMLRTPQQTRD
jgi:triphosphoribosyl-dephospho-CoA synthase